MGIDANAALTAVARTAAAAAAAAAAAVAATDMLRTCWRPGCGGRPCCAGEEGGRGGERCERAEITLGYAEITLAGGREDIA